MTRAFALALLTACAQGGSHSDVDASGSDGNGDGQPDAMPLAKSWIDDTAADFNTGTVDKAAVEAFGGVTTAAYYTGGLLVHGSDSDVMGAAAGTTWANVTAFTATNRVAISRSSVIDYVAATPQGLGLTNADTFSLWFEGEIFLDAGQYTFEYLADDHGFVEIQPPGAAYTRVASCDFPAPATGTFDAAAAGWYPIRLAQSEATGNALVQLRVTGPGIPTLQPVPRARLRTKVNGIVGLMQAGFDDGHELGDTVTTIDQTAPANINWATGNPTDLGITAADDFSVRWSGQMRIDMAGMYAFHYVTDDGQRLWIDGQKIFDAFDDTTHDQTSNPIALTTGWHDLVIDQTERTGGALSLLSIASGPELAGQPLPVDRLRPAEGRGERYETGFDRTDRAIPDAPSAGPSSVIALTAPAGASVVGVDVSYSFTHSYWSDLEVRLIAPNGATAIIRDNTGGSTSGVETQRLHVTSLDGAPVAGNWSLRMDDTVGQDTGTLLDFQVTPHYIGGENPIATAGTYDSAIKDLGNVASLVKVSWTERLPPGADIQVRVRSGDTAAACMTAQWSAPITDPMGGKPSIMPRRFVQYRVEMTSNGTTAPILDKLQLDYTINP